MEDRSRRVPTAPPIPRARLLQATWREWKRGGPAQAARKTVSMLARNAQFARYRFSPRRLTWPLERVSIDRPIFMLGIQGGGGTLLSRCMQRNPKIVYASGNFRSWSGPDEIHNSPHLNDMPESLRHRSYHFGTVNETVARHERYGYQRSWLYAIDEFLPHYSRTAEQADERTAHALQRVLKKIIVAYARNPADCRLLDKSQLYTIQVPYLAQLLGGCHPRFILLARDPYAACARAVAKEYGPERGGYISDDLDTRIRCTVEHWSNSYRLALESAEQVPMLVVRYEDALEDIEATLRRMCDFCELEFDPRQLPGPDQPFPLCYPTDHKWFPIHKTENEKYLRGLDARLADALNERCPEVIERLGYELRAGADGSSSE